MTPLLIFGFGIAPAVAVGTDLLYAAITKMGGIWTHHRQNSVDWKIAGTLALGSLPTALITIQFMDAMGVTDPAFEKVITTTLGVALILTSTVVIFRKQIQGLKKSNTELSDRQRTLLTVLVGSVLGVLVTLTSVGAGALGAATLLFLYPRLSSVRIVGTDIAHAVPLTAIAGLGHVHLGTVDFGLLGYLVLGSLPGIYLGSRLSGSLPDNFLRPVLASILMLIGIRFIF